MKLVFASPTYGPVDPQALKSQRAAIMHAASHGVTWVGDASPDRVKFDASRNLVVQSVLDVPQGHRERADAIFWCDSDIILPPDAISRLVAAQKDFVTGIYFQRGKPHWPLISHFDRLHETFNWFTDWPESVIAPIDGCGFGCVLTSVALLESISTAGPWFAFEKFSEDFDFCLRAAKVGFQLYVDTGVLCGHLADAQPVTSAHFLESRKELTDARV